MLERHRHNRHRYDTNTSQGKAIQDTKEKEYINQRTWLALMPRVLLSLVWLFFFRQAVGRNGWRIRVKVRPKDTRRKTYARVPSQAVLRDRQCAARHKRMDFKICRCDIPTYAVYLVRFAWTCDQS